MAEANIASQSTDSTQFEIVICGKFEMNETKSVQENLLDK